MWYTLMHKNYKVLDIEIDDDDGKIIGMGEVYCTSRIPVGIKCIDGRPDIAALKAWWTHRSIPMSRSGIAKALQLMQLNTPQELLTKCLGLSLSDQYWVRQENKNTLWEDVNFFDNDFSDDVGNALFGYKPKNDGFKNASPDASSSGWLKKGGRS